MASVSVNQLSALINFLESNRELALGNSNRSKEGLSQARRLWEQCSTVLNSVSANCLQKTPDQWRLYYNQYKSKLLKKNKMEKAEMSATGAGPSKPKKLMPLQERLYELLGREQNSQASVEVVIEESAENSQILEEEVVQILDHGTDIITDTDAVLEGAQTLVLPQLSGVGPNLSQEANRMPEPSPATTTPAPRHTDSPAPRQTVPPAPRRRRRRVQRSPRLVSSSDYDTTQEAAARLEAMEQISAEATREHAQATHRLAAALEALAERLREPIVIVLQNPPTS